MEGTTSFSISLPCYDALGSRMITWKLSSTAPTSWATRWRLRRLRRSLKALRVLDLSVAPSLPNVTVVKTVSPHGLEVFLLEQDSSAMPVRERR